MFALFIFGFVFFGMASVGLFLAFKNSQRRCAGCELSPSSPCPRAQECHK